MAKDPRNNNDQSMGDLLRDLLITQLGIAGVSQAEIRKIVGCDMNHVNRVVKPIKKARESAKQE